MKILVLLVQLFVNFDISSIELYSNYNVFAVFIHSLNVRTARKENSEKLSLINENNSFDEYSLLNKETSGGALRKSRTCHICCCWSWVFALCQYMHVQRKRRVYLTEPKIKWTTFNIFCLSLSHETYTRKHHVRTSCCGSSSTAVSIKLFYAVYMV